MAIYTPQASSKDYPLTLKPPRSVFSLRPNANSKSQPQVGASRVDLGIPSIKLRKRDPIAGSNNLASIPGLNGVEQPAGRRQPGHLRGGVGRGAGRATRGGGGAAVPSGAGNSSGCCCAAIVIGARDSVGCCCCAAVVSGGGAAARGDAGADKVVEPEVGAARVNFGVPGEELGDRDAVGGGDDGAGVAALNVVVAVAVGGEAGHLRGLGRGQGGEPGEDGGGESELHLEG